MGALASSLTPKPSRCKFGALLDEHADADDLATVDNDQISSADIAEFVSENWAYIGRTAVGDHRRRACVCYRGAN